MLALPSPFFQSRQSWWLRPPSRSSSRRAMVVLVVLVVLEALEALEALVEVLELQRTGASFRSRPSLS